MSDLILHDQRGDAVGDRYSIQTSGGKVLLLFNTLPDGILPRDVLYAVQQWCHVSLNPSP